MKEEILHQFGKMKHGETKFFPQSLFGKTGHPAYLQEFFMDDCYTIIQEKVDGGFMVTKRVEIWAR